MDHDYHPSYLGGGDWVDWGSSPVLGKKGRTHTPPHTNLSTNKPGTVVQVCNPSYVGGIGKRTLVQI
jgi:hypothetical protein